MTDEALHIQDQVLHHPRNQRIIYDPGPHTYHYLTDDGSQEMWKGVTSFLKNYAPFDGESIKYGIVNSKKPKYAHLNSIEEVEAEWQEARDYGSDIHDSLEYWGETGEYTDDECVRQAIDFFQKNKLYPIAFEHVVWCPILKRATPIDILLVNQWGELVVSDYKTSKKIKKSFYVYNDKKSRMEYPLTHLPNSNYYSYSLQIGLARRWLKRYYNFDFPIANYGLLFHIRDGNFTPHVTLSMKNEIDQIYEWEQKIN